MLSQYIESNRPQTFGTVLTVLAVYGSLCREYANHIGDVTPADRVYAAFVRCPTTITNCSISNLAPVAWMAD